MSEEKLDGHARRSVETRRKLLAAAKAAFKEQGFHDASTPAIAKAAGVSRGALYHQFPDKAALFRALVEEMQAGVVEQIMEAATRAQDIFEALKFGAAAYISAASSPDYLRIVMAEGPSVLGLEAWRAMDRESGVESLIQGLGTASKEGRMVDLPVEAMAHCLSGAMDQMVFYVGEAESRETAIQEAVQAIHGIIDGLKIQEKTPGQQLSLLE